MGTPRAASAAARAGDSRPPTAVVDAAPFSIKAPPSRTAVTPEPGLGSDASRVHASRRNDAPPSRASTDVKKEAWALAKKSAKSVTAVVDGVVVGAARGDKGRGRLGGAARAGRGVVARILCGVKAGCWGGLCGTVVVLSPPRTTR